MAVQLIRKVRDRQPQYAVGVNKRFAPSFLITPATGLSEAVSGERGSISGASIGPVAGRQSLLLDGTAGYGQFSTHPRYNITGALTLVWAGTLTDHANYNMLVTRSTSNGGTNNPFEFRCDLGTGYLTLTRANTSYSQFASTVGAPTGKRCVLIVTHGDNMSSSGGLSFYIDGVAVSGGPINVNAVGQASGNSEPLFIGKRADGHFHKGSTELVAGFSRVISPAEARQISENVNRLFSPETIPLFFSTVTAQYARPTSDVSSGAWTASSGSDLFAMLDETVASDSDYIVTTGASTCEVALAGLNDPAVSTGHIVRYRISSTTGGITVRLRQGTTTIASWTHNPAPTSLTTYSQTLSAGEADSITNYGALKLQFEAI